MRLPDLFFRRQNLGIGAGGLTHSVSLDLIAIAF